MHSKSYALEIISVLSLLVLSGVISVTALAQSDVQRQTIAVTYPLDETIEVIFAGLPFFHD